ncbi:MAG: hypothetical protein KKD28_04125, partial [Chloroflexi bacterium]|nr:hypothetical protein [Chloroflexota bacterium]
HNYDKYIADLRAKQAAGTLTGEEQIILEGETNGWPTPEPVDENLAAKATQTCEQFIAEAASWEPEPAAAYPAPDTERAYPAPKAANPAPEPALCPTLTPTQFPQVMMVPHRGHDPATLPPKSFEIDIYSIEIEGDVAKAIVHKSGVTSKLVLVKVDEQWYIAGAELLKFAP